MVHALPDRHRQTCHGSRMGPSGETCIPLEASAKVSGADDDTLEMTFPSGRILWYHFHRLNVRALNWTAYMDHTDNPAVAALLSRMEYREDEKGGVLRAFAHGILGRKEHI